MLLYFRQNYTSSMSANTNNINIVQVYMPTADKIDVGAKQFYQNVQ